jgi:hypothetical protein
MDSHRVRASRERWSSSTVGTLLLHISGLGMAPSIGGMLPNAVGAEEAK